MDQKRPFYGWKLLTALAAIVSVNVGMTYVAAAVVNAPMARDLEMSRGTLGLGSTVFLLCLGLSAPLVSSQQYHCRGCAFFRTIGWHMNAREPCRLTHDASNIEPSATNSEPTHKVARLPSELTERPTNGADKPKHKRKIVEPMPSVPRLISRSLAMGALTTAAAT